MKTAISIPDAVFKSADALAERLEVSRSELYARAVAEYVAKHQDAKVSERLNAVYAAQVRKPDTPFRGAQRRTLKRSDW